MPHFVCSLWSICRFSLSFTHIKTPKHVLICWRCFLFSIWAVFVFQLGIVRCFPILGFCLNAIVSERYHLKIACLFSISPLPLLQYTSKLPWLNAFLPRMQVPEAGHVVHIYTRGLRKSNEGISMLQVVEWVNMKTNVGNSLPKINTRKICNYAGWVS